MGILLKAVKRVLLLSLDLSLPRMEVVVEIFSIQS